MVAVGKAEIDVLIGVDVEPPPQNLRLAAGPHGIRPSFQPGQDLRPETEESRRRDPLDLHPIDLDHGKRFLQATGIGEYLGPGHGWVADARQRRLGHRGPGHLGRQVVENRQALLHPPVETEQAGPYGTELDRDPEMSADLELVDLPRQSSGVLHITERHPDVGELAGADQHVGAIQALLDMAVFGEALGRRLQQTACVVELGHRTGADPRRVSPLVVLAGRNGVEQLVHTLRGAVGAQQHPPQIRPADRHAPLVPDVLCQREGPAVTVDGVARTPEPAEHQRATVVGRPDAHPVVEDAVVQAGCGDIFVDRRWLDRSSQANRPASGRCCRPRPTLHRRRRW